MLIFSQKCALLFFILSSFAIAGPPPAELLQKLPLSFEENRGQWDSQVLFAVSGAGGKYFLTRNGFTFVVSSGEKRSALRLSVIGANIKATLAGEQTLPGTSSYFRGRNTGKWAQTVAQFGAVRATEVRPGVDLLYHGDGRNLEYDIVLRPGSRPDRLRFKFEGAERARLDSAGNLILQTSAGTMTQHTPKVWQESAKGKVPISAEYHLEARNVVGIHVSRYNRNRPLIIDPVVSFATYLGGKGEDSANAVALDSAGNIYVAGFTGSTDFPASVGAYRVALNANTNDAFVTKLNPSGTAILYSTFIGGSQADAANAIAVDSGGNAYVAGNTSSNDFPTTAGSLSPTHFFSSSIFVTKLNASGNGLVYSTYLGTNYNDTANGIALDSSGAVYLTGSTGGGFPVTPGAFSSDIRHGMQNSFANDAYAAKLSAAGDRLVYATYVGGSGGESGAAIAIDTSGQAYITGFTTSSDFPVSANAFQRSPGGSSGNNNGFVVCVNPSGTALTYATYLGGSSSTTASGIAVDAAQNAIIGGVTNSIDFPTTPGAFLTAVATSGHGFVSKLNYNGTVLLSSTYLGGSSNDSVQSVAVDGAGSVIAAGATNSANFPVTPGAFPTTPSINNYSAVSLFLTKFNSTLNSVFYSTLYGSSNSNSYIHGLALDSAGNPVMSGSTLSKTFPTPAGSIQRSNPDNLVYLTAGTGFVERVDLTSGTMCSLALSTSALAVPLTGSSGTITVTVPQGCPWEATATLPSYGTVFITLGGSTSGVGSGSFTYAIANNNSSLSSRSGFIAVGAISIPVTQPAGSCILPLLSPTTVGFDMNGGLFNLSVTLPPGCYYTPTSSAPWLQLTSSAQLNGSATISYFVARNDYATRYATLNIAGTIFGTSQLGGNCSATITSPPASLPAQGGTGVFAFTISPANCPWTANSLSPWLSVTTAAGTGSGVDGFAVAPNPGSVTRSGQISLGGQQFTVTQTGGGGVPAPNSYTVSTIVGSQAYYGGFSGDGGPAFNASVYQPRSVVFDSAGNLFIADTLNSRIRKVDTTGTITTIAGNGVQSDSGDGGPATSAGIGAPAYLQFDAAGNLVFSTYYRIRSISPAGVISTLAGTGIAGNPVDGSPAASALPSISGLALDTTGGILFSDSNGNRVRRLFSGILSYYAGNGTSAYGGDGAAPLSTAFGVPGALTLDAAGNVYSSASSRFLKIHAGVVSSVAGGGPGPDGENVAATSLSAVGTASLVSDLQGNLLYVDGSRIRRITADGKVNTIAGSTNSGSSGDGGAALAATFSFPIGLAVDKSGNIAVSDSSNNRIRLLTPLYSACIYNLSGNNLQVSASPGNAVITVNSSSGCAWNATSNVSWITVTPSGTGTGPATLTYSFNGPAARTGTVYIAGQLVTVTQGAGSSTPTPGPAKAGVFQPNSDVWALDSNGNGGFDAADRLFAFVGSPGDIAVVGDWTGDGKAKAGVYRNGFWILDLNNNGAYEPGVDRFVAFGGQPGDVPVVGDWNGDGHAKIGFYRGGFWFLDVNGTGAAQVFAYGGNPGEQPVVGDWNGDGRTKIGYLMANGNWVLDYNGNGSFDAADKFFSFPYVAGDKAVVGDWNGTHTTKVGIYRAGFWILDYNGNGVYDGPAGGDKFYAFGGNAGEVPIVGDWSGDGKSKIGYYLRGFWAMDYNGNGSFDGLAAGQDRFFALGGASGEQPVVGAW